MTTRKMFTILLVANLLTVALVTAAFQAGGLAAAGPAPRTGNRTADHDPNLPPTVPETMNYQGILKDSGGTPLSGSHNLTFTIYRYNQYISSWESVWTETQNGVQVTNGLFNVELGSVTPLRGGVFTGYSGNWDDGALELGVKVDGGAELSTRTSLVSVPYAHRAEYVNRFPKPHYDSGWTSIAQGETKTFTHNLGGDTDDYVVDVQFKDLSVYGVHHWFDGIDYDQDGRIYGATWHNLTTTSIQVWRGDHDCNVAQVRVRIWRIE